MGTEWKPEIEQAWMGWTYSAAFRVRLGLFLVPFGRMNEANRPYQTMLVAFPYPYGEVFPASWREIGAMLEGQTGIFRYSAYIGNGLAEADTTASGQQIQRQQPETRPMGSAWPSASARSSKSAARTTAAGRMPPTPGTWSCTGWTRLGDEERALHRRIHAGRHRQTRLPSPAAGPRAGTSSWR